jgi:hypothetical protein
MTTLTERWIAAWDQISDALRGPESSQAVAALLNADGILTELGNAVRKAREELEGWFRDHAQEFNNQFPNCGSFNCCWNVGHDDPLASDWRLSWANSQPLPAQVGAKLAGWIAPQMQGRLTTPQFQKPVRVVTLLSLFGINSPAVTFESAVRLFASEDERQELATVCPILALLFLPAPDLLERFFQSNPTQGVRSLARRLLYWSSGLVIPRGVEDRFDQLNTEQIGLCAGSPVTVTEPELGDAPDEDATLPATPNSTGREKKPSEPRKRDIIEALLAAGKPLQAGEIKSALGYKKLGTLKRDLAWMCKNSELTNERGEGYWLAGQPKPE